MKHSPTRLLPAPRRSLGQGPASRLFLGALVAALAFGAWTGSAQKAAPPSGPQTRFNQFVERWLEDYLGGNPVEATALGVHTHDSKLGDFSAESFRARGAAARQRLGELQAIPIKELSTDSQADYRVLEGFLNVAVKDLTEVESWKTMPALYSDAPTLAAFLMVSRDYAPAETRIRDLITRLEQVPSVLEAGKRNLSNPPRVWTETAIESTRGGLEFFETSLPEAAGSVPVLRDRLLSQSRGAADAYRDYLQYLETDLLPRSRGDFKAGRENFNFYLKNTHHLNESSDQLLAVGQAIFDRTRRQIADVARLIDPAKPWKEVLDQVKQHHPAAPSLLDEYRKEVARARAFVLRKDLVEIPAGENLQILETPLFQRSTIPYAQYFIPPPFEKGQTGYFTVTPVNGRRSKEDQEEQLRGHSHGDIVNTVVHEAYPGHHTQYLHGNRNASLVKKTLASPLLSEGWALYTEELFSEAGYYTPEERLIQLQWTLVRAARVLADIGLHTGSMTYEDAVNLLADEVRIDRPGAASEVKRYTLTPTQPLSYLIGREILFRIRSAYMRKQGKKYKARTFHDTLLSYGSIPPTLIEDLMQQNGLLER